MIEAQTPDSDNNLIGAATGGGIIAARLGALTDNGGLSFTQRPDPDSPLLDHYDGCTGIDQTGQPRGLDFDGMPGNDCDIGAVELAQTLFADGFENTVKRRGYDARGMQITRAELKTSLPSDGRARVVALVLNHDGSAQLLVHGRRVGERIEIQQSQLEQGHWHQGRWRTIDRHDTWLHW